MHYGDRVKDVPGATHCFFTGFAVTDEIVPIDSDQLWLITPHQFTAPVVTWRARMLFIPRSIFSE